MKIFLIGFMGSGKTHWGRIWADHHGMAFTDLDALIEQAQHQTISAIFEEKGEAHFRELEAATLRSLTDTAGIIACGGGAACFHNNMPWMNEHGICVYLSASPQQLLDQVMGEREQRPLIKKLNKAELLFFIEQKLKEREPFYKQAEISLPIESLAIQSLEAYITH
ncbi:MAG: shikimate kinase [Sphingobacteriales bacterium]|nr:shikimate kinase [Sphingobacteriales bacterium]